MTIYIYISLFCCCLFTFFVLLLQTVTIYEQTKLRLIDISNNANEKNN